MVAAAAQPAPAAAPPQPLLTAGERVEVLWGDEWYAGTFTSSRRQDNVRLHRINYDAANGHRAQAKWHDLTQEEWRRI